MEEDEKIKTAREEKLKKIVGNVIWGHIQVFCQRNGINHFESQVLPSDSGVSSYIEIEKNKYLNILFSYSSYEKTILYLPVLYDYAKKIIHPLVKVRSKYINNWRIEKNEIPKLKAGVLSEDAVWNLLENIDELKKEMNAIKKDLK